MVATRVEQDYGIMSGRLRPMISAVTLGEMYAFAQSWPKDRLDKLNDVLEDMLVIDLHRDDVLSEYAKLHKYSVEGKELAEKGARGKNIGHNDLWVAAAANAVGAVVLTTDEDLLRLPQGTVRVIQVNSKSGVTEQTVP